MRTRYPRGVRCLAIIPAFNERGAVGTVVSDIRRLQPDFDVVVIDDGSGDGTSVIAQAAGAVVVRLPLNLGIGGAVQTGYLYADRNGFDIAIQVDADGQHPVDEIDRLVKPLAAGEADMVIGSRFLEGNGYQSSGIRRIGIRVFARLVSLIIREHVTDTTSGFRGVNRKGIRLFAEFYPQDYPEVETQALAHKHGLRLIEVPVSMRPRQAGSSSIRLWASTYYMIKVTLALLVGVFRGRAIDIESGTRLS